MELQEKKTNHQVVVGVDGSEASREALRWAARLVPTLNTTIHAVTAWEYPLLSSAVGGLRGSWKPDETAKEILKKS